MPKKGQLKPIADRLWSRVVKTDTCWLWQGYRLPSGHGAIGTVGKKTEGVHRVSWRLAHGEIPDGMHVCHHCDVPNCVNPAHLFIGTNADNVADREAKGRQHYKKPGMANGRARLTDDQVRAIHGDPRKQDAIAAAFGVSQSTVHRIKATADGGWKHLGLQQKRVFHRGVNRKNYSTPDEYRLAKEKALKLAARKQAKAA